MKIIKRALLTASFFLLVLTIPRSARASEGIVVLKSTTQENFRCFAASVQMRDLKYVIPITCRNLLYPAGENIFNYVLWASSVNNGKPIKLGTLGFGRQTVNTKTTFTDLYVTTEKNPKVEKPNGPVVMRGKVQTIEIYFREDENEKEKTEEESILEETTPTPTTSSRERLVTGLRRAGLVSALALVSLLGLVFVLTRKR